MSVTTAAALFETNFFDLPSFSLCHVKVAVITKRAAKTSYWDRGNVGIWKRGPPAAGGIGGVGTEPPALGNFTIF